VTAFWYVPPRRHPKERNECPGGRNCIQSLRDSAKLEIPGRIGKAFAQRAASERAKHAPSKLTPTSAAAMTFCIVRLVNVAQQNIGTASLVGATRHAFPGEILSCFVLRTKRFITLKTTTSKSCAPARVGLAVKLKDGCSKIAWAAFWMPECQLPQFYEAQASAQKGSTAQPSRPQS